MDEHIEKVTHIEEELAGSLPWRRLFLDATTVEDSEGLWKVFPRAEKHPANPLLEPEKPWEGDGICIGGTAMRIGDKITLRYRGFGPDTAKGCLIQSDDGVHWERPNLGLVEYQGSKSNNIVAGGTGSIIRVREPQSPENQWAMYSYGGNGVAVVKFSEDAINWRTDGTRRELFRTSDVTNWFYDPYEERYVSTWKVPNRRHRACGLALSRDGLEWHKPIDGPVFGADDLDPDATQVYGMPVFPYQGMYIGLPWMYHSRWMKYGEYTEPKQMYEAQEGSPCTVDVQLAWSWDLISWTRTHAHRYPCDVGRKPFIELGEPGEWDCGMIYTVRNPVIVGDELYFYYYGCDNIHDKPDVRCCLGLATIKLDRFCGLATDPDNSREGWLISRREVFRTPRVTVNAMTRDGDGFITAEILDRWNKVIPGFSREECIPFSGDSVRGTLEWRTKTFPADMLDADKKIRFFLRDALMYSYLPEDIDTERDQGNRRAQ